LMKKLRFFSGKRKIFRYKKRAISRQVHRRHLFQPNISASRQKN
jgi:hypothetical protein